MAVYQEVTLVTVVVVVLSNRLETAVWKCTGIVVRIQAEDSLLFDSVNSDVIHTLYYR
jgi:hypothetical protein